MHTVPEELKAVLSGGTVTQNRPSLIFRLFTPAKQTPQA